LLALIAEVVRFARESILKSWRVEHELDIPDALMTKGAFVTATSEPDPGPEPLKC
jgi:hypothetical protein